jgi:hypothetical protein
MSPPYHTNSSINSINNINNTPPQPPIRHRTDIPAFTSTPIIPFALRSPGRDGDAGGLVRVQAARIAALEAAAAGGQHPAWGADPSTLTNNSP